jgi:hypothetical protein
MLDCDGNRHAEPVFIKSTFEGDPYTAGNGHIRRHWPTSRYQSDAAANDLLGEQLTK